MATVWRALGKCRLLMNAAKSATATTKTNAKPLGILKPQPVSPILQDFIGDSNQVSRAGAVKKVWEYIKLHNLQDPNNKKEIICDQKLKILFSGKDRVGFLEIARLLSQHFIKTA